LAGVHAEVMVGGEEGAGELGEELGVVEEGFGGEAVGGAAGDFVFGVLEGGAHGRFPCVETRVLYDYNKTNRRRKRKPYGILTNFRVMR
jgi:hypothetical protein